MSGHVLVAVTLLAGPFGTRDVLLSLDWLISSGKEKGMYPPMVVVAEGLKCEEG
jgi:hypothetical protein